MSDLKNCPLCGDNNLSTGFDGLLKQHYISCVDCDLTIYGSKTGVIEAWNTRAQDALNDKGPWSAKQEPVTMSFNDVWVESEDFKHAVRLYVYGNFDGRKQCFSYAENIAEYLNDYDGVANQMREHVHRKSQLEAQDAEVERLRGALTDILDGSSQWYEIQENTGLPADRCRELQSLYEEIMKGGALKPISTEMQIFRNAENRIKRRKLAEKQATEKLKSLVPNGFSDLGQGRYIHVYDYNTGEWSIQKVTNTDYACTIRFPSRKSAQAALEIMGDQMNDLLYGQ